MRHFTSGLLVSLLLLCSLSRAARADHTLWFNTPGRAVPFTGALQSVKDTASGGTCWAKLVANGYFGHYGVGLDAPSDAIIDSVILCYSIVASDVSSMALRSRSVPTTTLGTSGAVPNSAVPARFAFDIADAMIDGALTLDITCVTTEINL